MAEARTAWVALGALPFGHAFAVGDGHRRWHGDRAPVGSPGSGAPGEATGELDRKLRATVS